MKRVAMVAMVALTACSNGEADRPPVDEMTHDAADEKPAEASAPDVQMPEAAPPVDASDAGPDAADAGPEADAIDAPVEASTTAQCCNSNSVVALCGQGADCDTDAGFCAVNQIAGSIVNCPPCAPLGQTFQVPADPDAGPDAGYLTLSCGPSQPFAITADNVLVCVCPTNATRCLYGGPTHTSAGCF